LLGYGFNRCITAVHRVDEQFAYFDFDALSWRGGTDEAAALFVEVVAQSRVEGADRLFRKLGVVDECILGRAVLGFDAIEVAEWGGVWRS
jgi:hypothetical protein